MKLITDIKKYTKRQAFSPGILSIFTNPFHFARKGLFESIKSMAFYIKGDVLDVGCGVKPYKDLFNYKSYTGLDYDKKNTNNNQYADILYDGTVFPFDDKSFESCFCSQVLEHVFNPEEFISEINRILKLNGILLLTVPFVWDEHEQPYDYARYSSFGIVSILEKNGFNIMMKKKSVNDIRVVFQILNVYIIKKIVKTKYKYLNILLTVIFISPFNILGTLLKWILPVNNDLYLDNIILCRKVSN